MTRRHERQPCTACGASKLISVQHHVHLVAESSPEDPNCTRYVWLCPNCHAITHSFASNFTIEHWDQLVAEGLITDVNACAISDLVFEMKRKV